MSKKVFIGVGHGGKDPGAERYIIEKEYTLKTAFALAEILSEYGIDYKLSRTQDIDTDMDSKVAMCNKYNPDLVVDIHFNAGGGQGFEVYHSIVGGTSKKLANNINDEVKKIMSSRGIKTKLDENKRDYFAIIRLTEAPAILLEGGFVDNKKDADFMKQYKSVDLTFINKGKFLPEINTIYQETKDKLIKAKECELKGVSNDTLFKMYQDSFIAAAKIKELILSVQEDANFLQRKAVKKDKFNSLGFIVDIAGLIVGIIGIIV